MLVRPAPVDADVRVAAAPRRRDRAGAGLPARRRRLLRGRAPLHRRRQVPGRPAGDRRRHVPVLPGHPRGEGLHPRPGPGAAGDARARRPGARLARRPRCTTRSTCACPARAAPATARPASTWPPTRPRCCTSPTGAGCARGRTTRSAGCRAGPTSPPARPGLVNARARARGSAAGWRSGGAGVDQRRDVPPFAAQHLPRSSGPRAAPARTAGTPVALWVDSFTDHFAPEVARAPRSGCWRPPATAVQVPRRRHLLRADLDHHRPARRRPRGSSARPSRALAPLRRRRRPDRRARALVHGGAAQRRRSSCSTARRPSGVAAGHPHARRAADRHARAGQPPSLAGRGGRRPAALPPRTRCWAGRPTRGCCAAPARRSPGSAAAAGWPATGASSAGTTTCRWRSPSSSCCPPSGTAGPDAVVLADGFSCRTQLDQLAGRRGVCTWPSCSPGDVPIGPAGPGAARRPRPGLPDERAHRRPLRAGRRCGGGDAARRRGHGMGPRARLRGQLRLVTHRRRPGGGRTQAGGRAGAGGCARRRGLRARRLPPAQQVLRSRLHRLADPAGAAGSDRVQRPHRPAVGRAGADHAGRRRAVVPLLCATGSPPA